MSTIIFNGTLAVYILSDASDTSQWPLVIDGIDKFENGLHFEPTIVTGITVTAPMNYITLVNGTVVQDAATPAASQAAALSASKAALLIKIDADVDAIYRAAIGERGPEYDLAESQATAFKAAGYAGAVPSSVQAWATAKGWTAQQAADDILAMASQLNSARDAIRAARLLRKEQARTATTAVVLDTVRAQWTGFVAAIRAALGITT